MVAQMTFKDLQHAQRVHDERYHREVFNLSSPERVKHYCLHLAKYVGRFARNTGSDDELLETLRSTLTDAMIISLALSDILNIDIDEQLEREFGKRFKPGFEGWASVIDDSGKKMELPEIREYALKGCAEATGTLCRVAESFDRIESLDHRSLLIEGLLSWLSILIVSANQISLNLPLSIQARWKEVEQKQVS